ncbi:MAG: PAS domain S-box protein [Nitrospiraceae bacterium]|nr:PAS domain S-box protein [Nitrospiraceae bacterium]
MIQHLFDNSEFLHNVFDAIPSFLFVVDSDARIQHLNEASLSLLGTEKTRVLYNKWGEALHCIHASEAPGGCGHSASCRYCVIRNSVGKVFNGGRVYRETAKMSVLSHISTEEKYFAVTASPFSYLEEKFALIVLEDVTKEKMLEEALERRVAERTAELAQSEARYRNVLETSQEGIWFLDAEGRITFVNRSLAAMLEYKEEDLLGRFAFEFMDQDSLAEFRQALTRQKTTKTAEQLDLKLKAKDGSPIFSIMSLNSRLDADGSSTGFVGMVLDITERKRLESVAHAATLMDNVGYVFSGVRHEIGNPINALKITLAVLRKNFNVWPAEKSISYLEQAAAEIGKMEFLLKSLKSFNIYEHLEPERIELAGFFDKFHALIENDFREKGIKIGMELQEGAAAFADSRALQQVLLNLVTNAGDALEGTAQPQIRMGVQQARDRVIIKIEDNGRGIPEKNLKDLFKPFHTTKAKGTGLGLAIVKKMMVKMNGAVEITSQEGRGTTVGLFLPASDDQE